MATVYGLFSPLLMALCSDLNRPIKQSLVLWILLVGIKSISGSVAQFLCHKAFKNKTAAFSNLQFYCMPLLHWVAILTNNHLTLRSNTSVPNTLTRMCIRKGHYGGNQSTFTESDFSHCPGVSAFRTRLGVPVSGLSTLFAHCS